MSDKVIVIGDPANIVITCKIAGVAQDISAASDIQVALIFNGVAVAQITATGDDWADGIIIAPSFKYWNIWEAWIGSSLLILYTLTIPLFYRPGESTAW